MVHRFPVLVATSNLENQKAFGHLLEACGLEPVYVNTARGAMDALLRKRVALAICADELPDGTFRDVLGAARRASSNVPVVVTSRLDDTAEYCEAMSLGAFDFIASPYSQREVEWIIERALPRAS